MSPATANPYDEFPYLGRAYYYTHPDRLCTYAVLAGLKPTAVENCRVLELGCGDGGNLLPMAYILPGSHFHGIDLAAEPVARANERARELGLSNVSIETMDILDFPADAGPYDYIIAHGIYSWVPPVVREKLLTICGTQLAPHGVAYISYKTHPGSYTSTIVHEMVRYQATRRPGATAREIVRAGLDMLRMVAESSAEPNFYRAMLAAELKDLEARVAGHGGYELVYHDIGVEISDPITFHKFMAQAGRHGLQFLAEVRAETPNFGHFTPATQEVLHSLRGDVTALEQYKDFLTDQNFRRTLICRADAAPDHAIPPPPERIYPLYAASAMQFRANPDADPDDPLANEDFVIPAGPKITVNQPVVKAAFRCLERAWPRAVSFTEMMEASDPVDGVSERAAGNARDADAVGLATTLVALFHADLVNLTTGPSRMCLAVSERPVASAFVRHQIMRGLPTVTNLGHGEVDVKAVPLRKFLTLLDGTRDHAAILRDWQRWLETVSATDSTWPTPEQLRERMDSVLQNCVRQQFLVE